LKSKKVLLYTDGGARGNPGPAGAGVVILDEKRKKLKEIYKFLGDATNNVAEYNALIIGLEEASAAGAEDVVLHLDSELVAKQLSGEYKVKDANMKGLFAKTLSLLKGFKSFEIKRIDRSRNKEADRLVNKAINLSSLF